MKTGRGSHQPNPTFNRLHEIIARREARQGLLLSSMRTQTSILHRCIVNAPYLYNHPQLINNNPVFQNQPSPVHLSSLPTHPFLPSSHLSSDIVSQPQVSSFTSSLCNINYSSYNRVDSDFSAPSTTLPPRTEVLLTSTSSVETQINRIIRDYRISNSAEILPPRFDPRSNPLPSEIYPQLPVSHSSQLQSQLQSQETSFAPSQQRWSTHD